MLVYLTRNMRISKSYKLIFTLLHLIQGYYRKNFVLNINMTNFFICWCSLVTSFKIIHIYSPVLTVSTMLFKFFHQTCTFLFFKVKQCRRASRKKWILCFCVFTFLFLNGMNILWFKCLPFKFINNRHLFIHTSSHFFT